MRHSDVHCSRAASRESFGSPSAASWDGPIPGASRAAAPAQDTGALGIRSAPAPAPRDHPGSRPTLSAVTEPDERRAASAKYAAACATIASTAAVSRSPSSAYAWSKSARPRIRACTPRNASAAKTRSPSRSSDLGQCGQSSDSSTDVRCSPRRRSRARSDDYRGLRVSAMYGEVGNAPVVRKYPPLDRVSSTSSSSEVLSGRSSSPSVTHQLASTRATR